METKEFLRQICDASGVSGYEKNVSEIITEEFKKYCDQVSVDRLGNVIGLKKGNGKGKLLLAAHMDEIGLMVSKIEKNGFLKFVAVGGYDPRTLVGQEVILHGTKDILGVIGMKPPHLMAEDEKEKAMQIDEMHIDTGYSSEKLEEIVKIGTIVTINRKMQELLNDTVAAKSLDDRAGVASFHASMKELQNYKHDLDVYFVATVQEEVGMRGAMVSGFDIRPDMGIAVDVNFARTPELKTHETSMMGEGPVIAFGSNMHPKIVEILIGEAEKNNIRHQVEVIAGQSGTDANALQVSGFGMRTGLLSIPLKYMHTSVETVAMSDILDTGRLITNFIIHFNDGEMEDLLCL